MFESPLQNRPVQSYLFSQLQLRPWWCLPAFSLLTYYSKHLWPGHYNLALFCVLQSLHLQRTQHAPYSEWRESDMLTQSSSALTLQIMWKQPIWNTPAQGKILKSERICELSPSSASGLYFSACVFMRLDRHFLFSACLANPNPSGVMLSASITPKYPMECGCWGRISDTG